jgi:F0F1-type ATP synthase membrane subunit c/vacuolar-type H+-ATPase subunit K
VQSHVAETGEHPHEAFGTPREYADQVAQALGVTPVRGWTALRQGLSGRDLLQAVVCGLAGFALADGLWSLGAGAATTAGLPTWLVCLVAALVLGVCTARFVVAARHDPDADPVVDPRDGADMVPFGRRQVVLLAALPVLALVGMAVGGWLTR